MLKEGEALEFVVGNLCYLDGAYGRLPIGGGEELGRVVACGQQIANHFVPLGYEESLLLAELFEFKLVDVFNLIFADHY